MINVFNIFFTFISKNHKLMKKILVILAVMLSNFASAQTTSKKALLQSLVGSYSLNALHSKMGYMYENYIKVNKGCKVILISEKKYDSIFDDKFKSLKVLLFVL